MYVVGVDGCRGGWIAAVSDGGSPEFRFHGSLPELADVYGDASCIAVDISIGLAEGEPRGCDSEARKLLGPRRSSVFPAPDRRVLEAFAEKGLSYSETNSFAKATTGKGLSAQTYNILDKVSEADSLLTPEMQERVIEVHPELSFFGLDGRPMRHPKKEPGGFSERLEILERTFTDLRLHDKRHARSVCRPAAADDILDALVAAATARRVATGRASRLPFVSQTDRRGLRMEMYF